MPTISWLSDKPQSVAGMGLPHLAGEETGSRGWNSAWRACEELVVALGASLGLLTPGVGHPALCLVLTGWICQRGVCVCACAGRRRETGGREQFFESAMSIILGRSHTWLRRGMANVRAV